jgi:hypothetical protein
VRGFERVFDGEPIYGRATKIWSPEMAPTSLTAASHGGRVIATSYRPSYDAIKGFRGSQSHRESDGISERWIGGSGEHYAVDSGELLWRGTVKFSWMRLPLDAILRQDDQPGDALLPDNLLELGVTSLDGLNMNSGEVK